MGLFITEALDQIIKFCGQGFVKQAVFHKGTHDPRRTFGAQGNGTAALILKGIHLFIHDIGSFAYPAGKHFRVFKNRGANLFKPVLSAKLADHIFNGLPSAGILGQKILSALGGGNLCHFLLFLPYLNIETPHSVTGGSGGVDFYCLLISRQSRSPRSMAIIITSAVAMLVATGTLCTSQRRRIFSSSRSRVVGVRGSRKKSSTSISP